MFAATPRRVSCQPYVRIRSFHSPLVALLCSLVSSCGESTPAGVGAKSQGIESTVKGDCQAARERLLADCKRNLSLIEIKHYCETQGKKSELEDKEPPLDQVVLVKKTADLETPDPALPAFADVPKDGKPRAKVRLVRLDEHRDYFDRFVGLCEAENRDEAFVVLCEMEAYEHPPCEAKESDQVEFGAQ